MSSLHCVCCAPQAASATAASYNQFQKIFKKWQNELYRALKSCAQGGEYLQKRNALLIMSKMIQAAPADKPPVRVLIFLCCGLRGLGGSWVQRLCAAHPEQDDSGGTSRQAACKGVGVLGCRGLRV
jgi:hypothetical protein